MIRNRAAEQNKPVTAIANSDARTEIERLAGEQAALRRVAPLVARGAETEDAFAAVACEVAEVMHLPVAEDRLAEFHRAAGNRHREYPEPHRAVWRSVSASRLITGERDAVLIDAALTTEDAEQIVKWIEATGKISPRSTSPTATATTSSA